MEAKYIYGIIEASEERMFNLSGFDDCEEVYTVPYHDISAVVSNSKFVNYSTLPKDRVAGYLLAHQRVIEKIMDSYAVIPMNLGTYASNIMEVEEVLSGGYAMFKDIFRKITNKIEIDVVASWSDLNSIIKEIGEEQEVKEFKEEILSNPEGVSIKDQIRIGSLIKNILGKKRERCALEIETELKNVSIDFRKHDLMDDRMIFNIAFLIDKDRKAEFEERLDELNGLYDEKIDFRCVGPLPPYSFYTIETKKISFEEIDRARKRLCLNDLVTKDEIQKAYRNLALVYHPDRNPHTLDSDKEFNEVNKANRLLLEYCLSAEQGGKRAPYSLREEEFAKNAIIVRVRD